MIKKTITVSNPKGIHARPSAMLVKTSSEYRSEIILINGSIRANATSVLDLMTLCAKVGTVLELEVTGEDEIEAANAIEHIFTVTFTDKDI